MKKESLNEELNRMKKLMNFDISENSHDVLSENFVSEQNKTHIGTKRKGLDIVWGKGKTITLRKGKKNRQKKYHKVKLNQLNLKKGGMTF